MAFPSGRIYYADGVTSADVSDGSEGNNQLTGTEPGSSTLGATIGGGQSGTFWTFTSVANDPNLTSWDAGNYIAQVNITTLGADVTWGIDINRVDSTGTIVENLATAASSTYNTASVQTLTWNNATAKSVNAGDRLQIAVTGARAASHGNQECDVAVGTGNDSTTTKLNVPVAASTRRIFIVT
jgi:hypothetical protein